MIKPVDASSSRRAGARRWGVLFGPVAAVAIYAVTPDAVVTSTGTAIDLGHPGRATAAVGVWMAVWWMTEAVPVSATALVPLAAFPLLNVLTIDDAAAPYANPMIFLFLGGFMLALGMQRWGLERRIALVTLGVVGTEPRRVVGAFMVLTAVFSMWVSNTATVAMMLPIALGVIDASVEGGRAALVNGEQAEGRQFGRSLLLGIAAGASIGGVGTLIGTPPNLFLASFARDELGIDISFAAWLAIGLPIVAVLLPIAWVLLTHVLFPPDVDRERLADFVHRGRTEPGALGTGPMQPAEWVVMAVFTFTVVAWVTRPFLVDLTVGGAQPLSGLTDPGIAVFAGLVLFMIPVDRAGTRVLDWETARQLPWGILLLFGGGLSLAAAIDATAVSAYLGHQVAGIDLPPVLLIAAVAAGVVFLTELTSNTATAAALIPVVSAVAPALGVHPLALAVPVAVAASLAFMLPVATPPNAIVFGSGLIQMPDLMRMGLRLNLISIAVITVATPLIALPILGIDLSI